MSKILGINGLGRIGKLTLWQQVGRKYFNEIVVNLGRGVGKSFDAIVNYAIKDSTYGYLGNFLYGCQNEKELITDIDPESASLCLDGIRVRFLKTSRNPRQIGWGEHGVSLVVDATGKFLDPLEPDHALPAGSLRGHLSAGAQKVIVSAPFKIKGEGKMPEEAVTLVSGINDSAYKPDQHRIISTASCTTTCLAHMMRPLINHFGIDRILSASMVTVHAVTGSQQVLDRLPKAGATDLRKNRSVMNNIILTSTGAAKALSLVIPEMTKVGFIAESVRVPVATGSLVILTINLQEKGTTFFTNKEEINSCYREASKFLILSNSQNVSADIIGSPRAAVIIEGKETHTRTAEIAVNINDIPDMGLDAFMPDRERVLRVPVTQAVIYGWYDNEYGSYVNMLGDRIISVAESMN